MTKLRTMVVDAEARKAELLDRNEMDGPLFKIADDPRITPVGRVLRKLSIDELPQLFSVLRGSMSLVGPRPALPDEAALWDEQVQERLRVRPGITGMWQVSGRSTIQLRGLQAARSVLRRQLVAHPRRPDLRQDGRRRARAVVARPSGDAPLALDDLGRHRRRPATSAPTSPAGSSMPVATWSSSMTSRPAIERSCRRRSLRRVRRSTTCTPRTSRASTASCTSRPSSTQACPWTNRCGSTATTSTAPSPSSTRWSTAGVDRIVYSSSSSVYGTPVAERGRRGHADRRPRAPTARRS